MFEHQWATNCRDEDIIQRDLENERRKIDDARRCVDEKAQQLKSLSQQSALIAGFSMVVLVEGDKSCAHPLIYGIFTILASSVAGLMLT